MKYDSIIIGGGHNGLVAAAFLAKAGKKVLLLECRDTLGGAATTEEVFPGYKFNTGASDAGLFLPEIVEKLSLKSLGLEMYQSPVAAFAPQPDGSALTLWQDETKSREEIHRISPGDAEKFSEFNQFLDKLHKVLTGILTLTPPEIRDNSIQKYWPWVQTGLKLKGLGKNDMMEFLRVLPMPVSEFLDEWFENEALKGLLGATAATGSMQGPKSAGSVLTLLYHYLGEKNGGFKSSCFIRGGIGRLSEILAEAGRQRGVEIRTSAKVVQILLDKGKAIGIKLAEGEELFADVIISNADPRRTLFDLVGAPNLGPQFVRRVRNIRFKGTTAKMNLALKDLPQFTCAPGGEEYLSGHIIICPSLEYLELAYDDAKYGRFSRRPYLDIVIPTLLDSTLAPAGRHIISVTMQYAPYHLKGAQWDEQCHVLSKTIINTLSEYAPDLKEMIVHQQLITPLDLEREYYLTEGSIFHGQMAADQLLFMRPIPGWGSYRTPIKNLYLCGSGVHPGGGVTGAPGYNAAREVLIDFKS